MLGPTGIGKNLSSTNALINHCIKYNKDRIFMLSPFGAIIEQNATAIKNILDPIDPNDPDNLLGKRSMNVLEIHANFDVDKKLKGNPKKTYAAYKMLTENQSAPIIFESYVRFFESFLKNKSRQNRYLHHVMNSVIVLDEAQEINTAFMKFECELLNILVDQYGCSVVFCSATNPNVFADELGFIRGEVRDIVDDPIAFDARVSKARPIDVDMSLRNAKMNVQEMASFVTDKVNSFGNALCIVSTRKACKKVFRYVRSLIGDENVFHLSANMCRENRVVCLNEARRRLKCGEKVALISTKLIEAGVDVDFNCVIKTLDSIPSIEQAKGRVNREGGCGRIGHFYLVSMDMDDEYTISMGYDINTGKRLTHEILESLDVPRLGYEITTKFANKKKERLTEDSTPHNDMRDGSMSDKDFKSIGLQSIFNRGPYSLSSSSLVPSTRYSVIRGGSDESNFIPKIIGSMYGGIPFRLISEKFNLIPHNQTSVIVPYNDEAVELISRLRSGTMMPKDYRKLHKYVVGVYDEGCDDLNSIGAIDVIPYADHEEESNDRSLFGDGLCYHILNSDKFYGEEGIIFPSDSLNQDFSEIF